MTYLRKVLFVLAEPGPSSLGSMLMPAQETEWENLIRTGQMTPFGTKMPQKQEKKVRRIMLSEGSDFEKYLADQARLSFEKKKPLGHKKTNQKALSEKNRTKTSVHLIKSKGNKSKHPLKRESHLNKHMRKLQNHVLQIHSKAKHRKVKEMQKGDQRDDSEESEYVPDEEEFNDMEKEEEEFDHDDSNSDDYNLKPLPWRKKPSLTREFQEESGEDDYFPSSDDEDVGRKNRIKSCKDDGNEDYYRQRLRLVKSIHNSLNSNGF